MTQSQLTGEQYPMRNRLKRTCSAMAALMMAMGLPAAAHAQSDADLTSKLLIAILVKKGVLSQSDANSILQEAQAAASEAQATAPPGGPPQVAALIPAPGATRVSTTEVPAPPGAVPANTVMVSSTQTPDGTIHVTYIPQVVRDQITTAVTRQISANQQAQGYTGSPLVPDWVTHMHFFGDFRFRYEDDLFPHGNDDTGAFPSFNGINTGSPYDVSTTNINFPPQINVNEDRDRFRIRARLGMEDDLGQGFTIGIRLATGENDSPVSENQTLGSATNGVQGGDFSKYAIWLDRGYLSYTPQLEGGLGLNLSVGRFDNPFFATNLIWADDLGFDGLLASATYKVNDGITPFLTAGAFPVYNTDFNFASNQPSKFPSHNKWLYGVQAGTDWKFSDDYAAKFGIAEYLFTNIAGKLSSPCYVYSTADACSTDDDRPSFAQNGNTYMALRDIVPTTGTGGNSNGTTDQYQYFGLASGFSELAFTGEFDVRNFDPTEIWLVGEYVHNLAFNKADVAGKAVNNRGSITGSDTTGTFDGGSNGIYVNANIGTKQLTERWDWNAMLGYKYIESDSVVDGLNDSDFGLGGTNLKGYIVGGNVALSPNVWVRLRYLSADSIAGAPYKADVFQFDLNGKF
jgi:hypothetical protein